MPWVGSVVCDCGQASGLSTAAPQTVQSNVQPTSQRDFRYNVHAVLTIKLMEQNLHRSVLSHYPMSFFRFHNMQFERQLRRQNLTGFECERQQEDILLQIAIPPTVTRALIFFSIIKFYRLPLLIVIPYSALNLSRFYRLSFL